jgi:hypothetical protein
MCVCENMHSSLTDRLSYRFRNQVNGDELLHAAVYGQSHELLDYLVEVIATIVTRNLTYLLYSNETVPTPQINTAIKN